MAWLQDNDSAFDIMRKLSMCLQQGYEQGALQRRPHMVLLDISFYRKHLLPHLLDWVLLLLHEKRLGTGKGVNLPTIHKHLSGGSLGPLSPKEEEMLGLLDSEEWKLLNLSWDWLHIFLPQ